MLNSTTMNICICADILSDEDGCTHNIVCSGMFNQSTWYKYVFMCDPESDRGSEIDVNIEFEDIHGQPMQSCTITCDEKNVLLSIVLPAVVIVSIMVILAIIAGISIIYVYRLRKRIKM